jgi:hypothetical protein
LPALQSGTTATELLPALLDSLFTVFILRRVSSKAAREVAPLRGVVQPLMTALQTLASLRLLLLGVLVMPPLLLLVRRLASCAASKAALLAAVILKGLGGRTSC